MTPHRVGWTEDGHARSELYDDVFFSRADGLAETTHVFLNGNRLWEQFAALSANETFVIGELGFGSGLNMLATTKLWGDTAPAGAMLKLVSFEKHLLDAGTMTEMLQPWPHLAALVEPLLNAVAVHSSGDLTVGLGHANDVELTILNGDAGTRMTDMPTPAGAWFLDGFSPAKNPDLWSSELMTDLANQTAPGGTFATYTAAGWVRRNLEAAGFWVEKRPGFGTKREMMVGRLIDQSSRSAEVLP
ncbi:tRNA (5-methylaminomethyl-2-thiouridine)(34)-methyltransferase MnmD [Notoacmeibacter sp. MSK16QG-6]|uniref:tRNA (5-methylaminomethyl-2-thiouridine)(34)-methyltransferase MnmD n=1 Tax=Notoacmeibacter sp. MSK16QG-6 TaxID=2957982 RepID=UPI00209EB1DF|nr:tRNA (5-methylaminomethyl-2-thiouridine)(34)-methyltransferase MnmD [Notoacmeibacter sp. MSK16QG-6]MCP1197874.1 tRNA (5-methylaminomethyl-2-thiouridine)(34)-methyltransferase MnmD [Notoacmeibacter sp. MSK16QG-6]